jgi:hypothetical protein
MTDEYQYDNPNSKLVEYGGLALGGIILTLMVFFYPAVVLGVQAGLLGAEPVGQFIVGTITLIAIGILWKIAVSVSNDPDSTDNENITGLICYIIVVGLYIVCIGPAIQYVMWLCTDYEESGYEAIFTGFDWWWGFKAIWWCIKLIGGYVE